MNRLRHALLLLALVFMVGCSLPRITVLDDPLSPHEHLKLGLAYETQGDLTRAQEEYSKAAQELPQANLPLANTLFKLGRYQKAEQHYLLAMKALPGNPDPPNNLAWLLCHQGRDLDRACSLARQAVDAAPPQSKAKYLDTLARIEAARQPGGAPCAPPP